MDLTKTFQIFFEGKNPEALHFPFNEISQFVKFPLQPVLPKSQLSGAAGTVVILSVACKYVFP